MKKTSKIIIVLLLALSILIYQCWKFLLDNYDIQIYYPGIALLIFGFVFVIWRESKPKSWFRVFMELFLELSINNVVDEALFDPKKLGINETVFAVFILIRFIFNLWVLKKNKRLPTWMKK